VLRRLRTSLVIVCLLITLAAGLLWPRSYRRWDRFVAQRVVLGIGVTSADGKVLFSARLTETADPFPSSGWRAAQPIAVWTLAGPMRFTFWGDSPLHATPTDTVWDGDPVCGWKRFPRSLFKPEFIAAKERENSSDPILQDQYLIAWLPHWMIVVPTSLPPLAWAGMFVARTRRHRRATRAGTCTTCGYDLRATPARCPECGSVPTATISAATAPPPR
jgi:hypothetical protein